MSIESKKSQDLPFVYWRPRRVAGIVPVLSEGLRTRRTNARSLMRAGGDWCPRSIVRQRDKSSLPRLFVLSKTQRIGWGHPRVDGGWMVKSQSWNTPYWLLWLLDEEHHSPWTQPPWHHIIKHKQVLKEEWLIHHFIRNFAFLVRLTACIEFSSKFIHFSTCSGNTYQHGECLAKRTCFPPSRRLLGKRGEL